MDLIRVYLPLFDMFLVNVGYAYSQQIVMRAGVFSVGTAGSAALGAYSTAILVVNHGWSEWPALAAALLIGTASGLLLSIPLARLRGVYQAIASLAFVEIVLSLLLFFEDLTGGALGINRIPRLADTWHLLIVVGIVVYIVHSIGRSGVGRAFDALRQDEVVGAMLGVSIRRYHTLAFLLSGAIGGVFGGMHALLIYAIEPGLFGFEFLAMVLTFIVLGGRGTLAGPIVGAAIITALPELARPLAEHRLMAIGALMIIMITYFPNGVFDSFDHYLRQQRAARLDRKIQDKQRAEAGA